MKRMLAVLAAVGLVGVLAAPVAAKTEPVPFACEEWLVEITDPGTFRIEDGTAHLRGWAATYEVVGDAPCAGALTVVVNFNLDLETASGVLWGRSTLALDAVDGGYLGTFNAHWTTSDPLAADAEDIWVGRYVRQGFGALEGWQARGKIAEKYHWLILETGYAFAPGG